MTRKSYEWGNKPVLESHTKKKHDILRTYFRKYLLTRCQLPQMDKFRLAVVDGFAGGGLYKCGAYGSPILFIDTLVKTTDEINTDRARQSLKLITIECLLILNEYDPNALELLKKNVAPHQAGARITPNLHLEIEFHKKPFEELYPTIKEYLIGKRYRNVIFNLDPCGYTQVTMPLIRNIMTSWLSAEVLLTFMIESLLTYLSPDKDKGGAPLNPQIRAEVDELRVQQKLLSKQQWLGACEKIVYNHLRQCAQFVSPFAIANSKGWDYWLMHFANSYRARQVYNNILHDDCGLTQTHYGRSGLNMLTYDAKAADGQLYIFDSNSRAEAINALHEDIPRFIDASGGMMSVESFYAATYSETPAHSDDIHKSIIENHDIEVITPKGGKRREASAIDVDDTLKLKYQRSFLFGFD